MRKITRLRKAWQRNYDLYKIKGIYFCQGPIRYWLTPKQLLKWLKHTKHETKNNSKT